MSASQSDFHIFQRVGQPPTSSPAMPCWTLVDVWKNRSPTCCNNFDDDSGNGKHKKEPIVKPSKPHSRILKLHLVLKLIVWCTHLLPLHICCCVYVAESAAWWWSTTNQPERGTTVIQIPSAEGSRGNKRCDFSNFSDQSIKGSKYVDQNFLLLLVARNKKDNFSPLALLIPDAQHAFPVAGSTAFEDYHTSACDILCLISLQLLGIGISWYIHV